MRTVMSGQPRGHDQAGRQSRPPTTPVNADRSKRNHGDQAQVHPMFGRRLPISLNQARRDEDREEEGAGKTEGPPAGARANQGPCRRKNQCGHRRRGRQDRPEIPGPCHAIVKDRAGAARPTA